MSMLIKFLKNESGATALEYGLIIAGVSAAILLGLEQAGTGLEGILTTISDAL
ncbi:MAG: Flp family type IVb pilin [Hyphomicrobiales bacterium]|jgi:pilus assembly protein Flp/PilA